MFLEETCLLSIAETSHESARHATSDGWAGSKQIQVFFINGICRQVCSNTVVIYYRWGRCFANSIQPTCNKKFAAGKGSWKPDNEMKDNHRNCFYSKQDRMNHPWIKCVQGQKLLTDLRFVYAITNLKLSGSSSRLSDNYLCRRSWNPDRM